MDTTSASEPHSVYNTQETPTAPPAGTTSSSDDVVDMAYLKSLDGINKVVQMVFGLVAFICASINSYFVTNLGGGWVQFVSMTAFICTAILYIFHVFKIIPKFPDKIPFRFSEFVYYFLFTLFYFSCGILCSVYGYYPPVGAAAFFTFACLISCGISTYFCFMAWRISGEKPYFSSLSCFGSPSSSTSGLPSGSQY